MKKYGLVPAPHVLSAQTGFGDIEVWVPVKG